MELAAAMTEITGLGSEFNPPGVKRGGDEYSALLHKVKICLKNPDFKSITRDQLAVHLFLRDADTSMAKIATQFLQVDPKDQSMADFRTTLRQTKKLRDSL